MPDPQASTIWLVTTTVGTLAQGEALARGILERRLAACVQIDDGVRSFYRWQGQQCEDAEVRLSCKTTAAGCALLEAAFAELHPYELPQFVAWPVAASAAYANWVKASVAAGAPG